jgi:hypothetical protein
MPQDPFNPIWTIAEQQLEPPQDLELSRFLDISNGTYRLRDTSSLYATMPNVRQRVVILVRTMTWPLKQGKTFEADIKQRIRNGMRQMIDVEKVARLDGVFVTKHANGIWNRASVTISFTDLSTNQPEELVVER